MSGGIPLSNERIGLITAIMPAVLVILGGIGWLIRYHMTKDDKDGLEITQGQSIPVTALPEFLHTELDECQENSLAYRDALVRAGIDPNQVLRDAGLRPLKEVGADE